LGPRLVATRQARPSSLAEPASPTCRPPRRGRVGPTVSPDFLGEIERVRVVRPNPLPSQPFQETLSCGLLGTRDVASGAAPRLGFRLTDVGVRERPPMKAGGQARPW